jgi:hypothetical protein
MKAAFILSILALGAMANTQPRRLVFEKPEAIEKLTLKDLGPDFPADWSGYEYLVLEIRTSIPQRFHLIIQDKTGVRRLGFQPIGQNVWFRAAVPLKFFRVCGVGSLWHFNLETSSLARTTRMEIDSSSFNTITSAGSIQPRKARRADAWTCRVSCAEYCSRCGTPA